jgi:thioredoxin reductase (NADPH)
MYDIAVVGRGPAGVSAAINASIRNKSIIMFGKDSSKVLSSPIIYNYPGLPSIPGPTLAEKLYEHLKTTTAILSSKHITAIYSLGDYFAIQAEDEMLEAKAVILTVGVDFKKSIEGEDIFLGMGVSYCATCDAPLYKGKNVVVVGYNKESIEEVKFLSEICSKVTFVPVTKDAYNFNNNIEVLRDTPVRFEGINHAERLILKNAAIEADGFFVIKDSYPLGALVPGLEVDGPHVVVNKHMETNIKGLFAAGDVTGKPYQVAKAIGDGQIAALSAVEMLNKE